MTTFQRISMNKWRLKSKHFNLLISSIGLLSSHTRDTSVLKELFAKFQVNIHWYVANNNATLKALFN